MGQKENRNSNQSNGSDGLTECPQPLDTNDRRTFEKRDALKRKLEAICGPNSNAKELLDALECYCSIILESLEIE